MRFFFFLLAFFSAAAPSSAQSESNAEVAEEDCSPIDVSEHMGPVRDQGNEGWCFGFVAADLLSQHLKLKPEERVSAFDISAQYYLTPASELTKKINQTHALLPESKRVKNSEFFHRAASLAEREAEKTSVNAADGGRSYLALLAYQTKGGYCRETDLPSEKPSVYLNSRMHIKQRLSEMAPFQVKEVKDPFGKKQMILMQGYGGYPGPAYSTESQSPFVTGLDMAQLSYCNSMATSPVIPGIIKLLLPGIKKEVDRQVSSEIDIACKKRIPFPQSASVVEIGESKQLMNSLNNALSERIAIGIAYDPNYLFGGKKSPAKFDASHMSSIVGRRWNPNSKTCEFKLRNSWGVKWCPSNFPADRCENGNVWVSTERLMPTLSYLNYFPSSRDQTPNPSK